MTCKNHIGIFLILTLFGGCKSDKKDNDDGMCDPADPECGDGLVCEL